MSAVMKSAVSPQRQAYYAKIAAAHCTPLWEVLHDIVTPAPITPCKPYLWKWATVWPWIQESGSIISTEEAVRRVLILENPGMPGSSLITHSLYAGLQLILPGEIAAAHRHSQSALRFIMHGGGAYTSVDGQKITMNIGDYVITPSWTWHDHGNTSKEPMVWMDVLDVGMVQMMDAQFLENAPAASQKTPYTGADNMALFGNTMKPVEHRAKSHTSPMVWYPYERTREALETMKKSHPQHECWGHKLQYTNPVTGGWAMPTIGTFMQLLPKGFKGGEYRSTDSTIYSAVEGRGRCTIGGDVINFGPKDVFVCPSWMPYKLEADEDTVLFSASDRPVQQAVDLWRESF